MKPLILTSFSFLLLAGCNPHQAADKKEELYYTDTTQPAKQESPASTLNNRWHASGDLNKDGLADSAVVLQDTLAETQPYLVAHFLCQPG